MRIFSSITCLFLVILVSIGVLGVYSFTVKAAPTACGLYKSGVPVPDGYGAAYNVFSPSQQLVEVLCDTYANSDTAIIQAGAGRADQIVYGKGYHYRDGSWREITLQGPVRHANGSLWFKSLAKVEIPEALLESGTNYVVAYVCTSQGGQWKCGCADTACAVGKWQLQIFERGSAPECTNGSKNKNGCGCVDGSQCLSNICAVDTSGYKTCQAEPSIDLGFQNLPPAIIGIPYSASMNLHTYPDFTDWTIPKEWNSPLPPNMLWFSRDFTMVEGIALSPGLSGDKSSHFAIYGKRKSDNRMGILGIIIQKVDWASCSVTADCANLQIQTPVECRNNQCRYTWDKSE